MPTYDCKVIGDGKSPQTAFRPAIAELHANKGGPVLSYSCDIAVDSKGVPVASTVKATVTGDQQAIDSAIANVSATTGGKVVPADIIFQP